MPKMVSELSRGQNYEFSAEQGGLAANAARVFRILLNSPSEFIDIPVVCDAPIGSAHPRNPDLFCTSFSGVYEGESRMVILATFNYRTTPSADNAQDPQSQPPDIRPANWYTTTSLMEVPATTWEPVAGIDGAGLAAARAPENPAGDLYEVVTTVKPIINIFIEQWEPTDPTTKNEYAGYTNNRLIRLGSLSMPRRTVMFRGVQSRPRNDTHNGTLYRGWDCTYEFLFKRNQSYVWTGSAYVLQDVGWDVLQPQSGFNVKAFNPPGFLEQDVFGQPLRQDKDYHYLVNADGRPLQAGENPVLPIGVAFGDKVRAMIKIASGENISQRPSAQPIALNDDGTPRIDTANPKVLVYRYKVTEETDFSAFDLRLNTF